MKALTFDHQLTFTADHPTPQPSAAESLVRVTLAGICNTDLEITRGYADFRGVIGHEFVGVAETGPHAGKRVVGEINIACGRCELCLRGQRTHCVRRTVLGIRNHDGAMAEWLTLPHANLHVVPDSIRDEQAVFVEPLAAALEILEGAHIKPSERVIVLGDGKLGQLVTQVLALTGCDLTLVGRHANKLALAQPCGSAICLEADANTLANADVVIDCAGNASGFALASRLARARGCIILKSTFHGAQSVALTPIAVNELSIIGSRCGPFAAALRLLQRKLVAVEPLISAIYPLSDSVGAFERAQSAGILKVLLRCAA
jgi:threonine dehydrogenase-like Zn-dependent dehydrogenase